MLTIDPRLFLRVEQLPGGPTPLPLNSGFNTDTAYRALGLFNPSETSDAYFIFSNDRDEVWFVCNRHLRTVGSIDGCTATRLPLARARLLVARAAAAPAAQPVGTFDREVPA